MDHSPWCCKKLDTTERAHTQPGGREKGREQVLPRAFRGSWLCRHPDCRPPASSAVRGYTSAAFSHPALGNQDVTSQGLLVIRISVGPSLMLT